MDRATALLRGGRLYPRARHFGEHQRRDLINARARTSGERARSTAKPLLLLAPALLLFLLVFLYPIARSFYLSFFAPTFTLKYYLEILEDITNLRILGITIKISALTTLLCLLVGYPLAYFISSQRPLVRNALLVLTVFPLFINSLVRNFAWIIILGTQGLVNWTLLSLGIVDEPIKLVFNSIGVYVGLVYVLLPYMSLPLYSVMVGIDRGLMQAAENLGAGPGRTFLWVFLPLSLPGVLGGSLLVFILCLGSYITPAILGGNRDIMIAMLIESKVTHSVNWHSSSALSVVLLLATLLSIGVFKRVLGLQNILAGLTSWRFGDMLSPRSLLLLVPRALAPLGAAGHRALSRIRETWSGSSRRPWGPARVSGLQTAVDGLVVALPRIFSAGVIVFLFLPIIVVIPMAFNSSILIGFPPKGLSLHWFETFFTRRDWYDPLLQSLKVSSATMLFSTLLGTMAALSLNRGTFRGKGLFFALLVSPLVVPVIVLAVSIYFFFADLRIIGSFPAFVFAHSLLAIPPVVVVVSAALAGFNVDLERAAMNLGATPLKTFLHVTFPLLVPAILAAAFLAFMASFDELIISIFLVRPGFKLLTVRIWEGLRHESDNTVTAISALLVLVAIILITATEFFRKRLRRFQLSSLEWR